MTINKIHTIAGISISIFIGLHLFNHCFSLLGADKHIEVMTTLRPFYRNIFAESILFLAVAGQIYSGFKLFVVKKVIATTFFEKLQIWTGLYLALFLIIHLSAVLAGRFMLRLDTNFYFGAAGLNHFPVNLFFIPYYALAIISFFGHMASIHNRKVKVPILGLSPKNQSFLIFCFGILLSVFLLYGFTNRFKGATIPTEYNVLTGK